MPTQIKTGWLHDKDGEKFAPKTLLSQIQTNDGTPLAEKIQTDIDNILINADDALDGDSENLVKNKVIKAEIDKISERFTDVDERWADANIDDVAYIDQNDNGTIADVETNVGAPVTVNDTTAENYMWTTVQVGWLKEGTGKNLAPKTLLSQVYTNGGDSLENKLQNDLALKAEKTDVPTKISELTNDSGFIANTVGDLINYYTKNETYTQTEIDNKISLIPKFAISVVDTLPTSDISATTVYLVPGGAEDNLYTEYIYVNHMWEILGSQRVDLTGYALKNEIPTTLPASDVYDWAKKPQKPTYTAVEVGALSSSTKIPTKTSDLTNDSGFTTNTGTITGVSVNGTSIATSGAANIPAASTSAYGVVKLSSDTDSTSTELAATSSAVKSAYDLAKTASNNIETMQTTTINGLLERLNRIEASTEQWTFELENGSIVTKAVYVG